MDEAKISEFAPKQLDRILSFFARVEAKASFVFAVDSALLGVLAVHVERSDFEKGFTVLLLVVLGIALAASYLYIYRSSSPNLEGGHSSLIYFREIAKLREQEFVKAFRAQSDETYVDDILSQVWRNSQILTEKFSAVKKAFVLAGLSLLPWTAFLIFSSLTHVAVPVK
jgi:hypothetical protein